MCEADPFLCLRTYRQDSDLQASLDQREFAHLFEKYGDIKYRKDLNNFSLYIWGFAMPMIDYFKAENKILSYD